MKLLMTLASIATGAVASFGPATGLGGTEDTPTELTDAKTPVLRGRILFDGRAPAPRTVSINQKAVDGCCRPGETMDPTDRSLLVSPDGGIANVVVSIRVPGAEVDANAEPLQMDNSQCRFEPHVLIVPVGGEVEFHNTDSTSHNVHTYATRNRSVNRTISAGTSETIELPRRDTVRVTCDIHPWMEGWIYVTDTPYHAITDGDGFFTIEGLAPGDYRAELWHETLGKQKVSFTLGESGVGDMQWVLGTKKKRARRGAG